MGNWFSFGNWFSSSTESNKILLRPANKIQNARKVRYGKGPIKSTPPVSVSNKNDYHLEGLNPETLRIMEQQQQLFKGIYPTATPTATANVPTATATATATANVPTATANVPTATANASPAFVNNDTEYVVEGNNSNEAPEVQSGWPGGARSKKNKNRRKSKRTRKNHKKGL